MGNSSEKIKHLMEISEDPPQRIRRRKMSAQSENSPETSQLNHRDNISKTNGISSDTTFPKTVTFSMEKQCKSSSLTPNPTLLQATTGSEATERNSGINGGQTTSENEIKNLKGLVLLHLDIVQQQQSIISDKDKQIADLREETQAVSYNLDHLLLLVFHFTPL